MKTTGFDLNRRAFLGGFAALGALAGCRCPFAPTRPDLLLGVVSDIHITTPESCDRVETAFRRFRARGVDAVVIPGDLSDYGTKIAWVMLKQTWDKVFAGTDVVPLFCTGNHDFEGWWYGDMAEDMLANGYDGSDAIFKLGVKETWEEVFGEPYEPIRVRTVKGYDFVSVEYGSAKLLADWMAKNGARLRGSKPFFHFQHVPAKGTTSDGVGRGDGAVTKAALKDFPNCVSFTGHTHVPFFDERSIWQGEYTAIAVPSLSYACGPSGYENGEDGRGGASTRAMPFIPNRLDLVGEQGYVVGVYDDRMVVERHDLACGDEAAAAWIVPLPVAGERPYAYESRTKAAPAPVFPSGARVTATTRNTENRQGKWAIVLDCRFPSATMPDGTRVFDYEIRAVPKDGSAPLVKRFLSPAFAKPAADEPAEQRFWFDVKELPRECDYALQVYTRNCFGSYSAPLVSDVRRAMAREKAPKR